MWIDLEMTGLDPQTDEIVEIACTVTTIVNPDVRAAMKQLARSR